MNILLIGNGFDLAHGLPTKYGDFFAFCERVKGIYDFSNHISLSDYKSKYIDNWDMNDYIKNALLDAFEKTNCKIISTGGNTCHVKVTNKALEELYKHISQNTWLEYFLERQSSLGENWIDFETEISRIIPSLDELIIVNKWGWGVSKCKQRETKNINEHGKNIKRESAR